MKNKKLTNQSEKFKYARDVYFTEEEAKMVNEHKTRYLSC